MKLTKITIKSKEPYVSKQKTVSNTVNNAISSLWSTIGDIDCLSQYDLEKLHKRLSEALSTVDDLLYTPAKMEYPKKCCCKMKANLGKLPRGFDLKEFYFIDYTRSGCPKIEKRSIGDKYGITDIEVTNTGNSYIKDKHIKKVRVRGIKEDGVTPYELFFYDVYTKPTKALMDAYSIEADRFLQFNKHQLNVYKDAMNKYEKFVDEQFCDLCDMVECEE